MANETVTKSSRFYCVSTVPDICKTPIGASTPPIPYNVIGEFSDTTGASSNVKANSEHVFLRGKSKIPAVKGDNPGKAGGIKSGTVAKAAESKTSSGTLSANGKPTTQVGRTVWMNAKNTVGSIYERAGQAVRKRLTPLAKMYKESELSSTLHGFGEDAMDKGGKIVVGSGALAAGGAGVAATGVGLPVAAAMEGTAAAGGTVGTVVTAAGAGADTAATVMDHAADAILSGKSIDVTGLIQTVGTRLALNVFGRKVNAALSVANRAAPKAAAPKTHPKPGKKPESPPKKAERNDQKRSDADGSDGGKTKGKKKGGKGDKPSDCCPKNSAPGGKPVSTRKPVHLGTGEEVLYQTDFEIPAAIPIVWTRCYRSGSECEDWGLLGARWGTPFTSSIAISEIGTVYIDDTGRPVLLPRIAIGETLDNRKEGFTLARASAEQYVLTWRDGSRDTFTREPSADGWLPHGHNAVNVMRVPGQPALAQRFVLTRSAGRDGRGISIERLPHAEAGEPLLRITTDEKLVVEAIRAQPASTLGQRQGDGPPEPPRVERVEEVRHNGERVCHVRYRYAAAPHPAIGSDDPFERLPPRFNLVAQTNKAGSERTYTYDQHLLTACTTYTGFAYRLEWISLDALRERWAGSRLTNAELAREFPITLHNSYQARAIATSSADGLDCVQIDYVSNDRTRLTEANGGVLEYVFDSNWLAVEVFRLGGQQPVSLGSREWDSDGMLLAEVDGASRRTTYSYDAAGNLLSVQDPLSRETRFEYDDLNQPVAITDAAGNVTRLEYDEHGHLIAQTDALGNVTRYRFDREHRLVGMQDAKGGNKEIGYDRAGRVAVFTDCSGYRTLYRYDEEGRISTVLDALEQATRYEYNEAGWLARVVQPDDSAEQFEYDAEGHLVAHADAAGYKTLYRYNGHGLPVERIDALGYKVQYRYDEMLRLVELINQNGESYHFTYDVEGRLLTETGFDGLTTTYSYDEAGHMSAIDCGGRKTELQRDLIGQLLVKVTEDGSCRFQYDALGRLTAAVAPHAYNEFRYDAVGQLVQENCAYFLTPTDQNVKGPRKPDAAYVLTHAYDELGNRVQTVLPSGERVDILRYGSGHWHGTLFDGKTIADIERDRLHREHRRCYSTVPVLSATTDYDPSSRITRMTLHRKDEVGEQFLRDRKLRYDAVGNLLEIEHNRSCLGVPMGPWKYRYDPLGNLVAAENPELTENFAFDPAGNPLDVQQRLKRQGDALMPEKPEPHVSVVKNQIVRYESHEYSYDRFGNAINKCLRSRTEQGGRWKLSLAYDSDHRIVESLRITQAAQTAAKYIYDAFGRRIAKEVMQAAPARSNAQPMDRRREQTLFVWDGNTLVQEVTCEHLTSYVYEPGSFIPLAQVCAKEKTCWQVKFYSCDHIGTPIELLELDGSVTWLGSFMAWGQEAKTNLGDMCDPQPIRFQGHYADRETGLYYNRHRYYDPDCGRYLTPDPIRLIGGLNFYKYGPNPTMWVDPLGLSPTWNCKTKRWHESENGRFIKRPTQLMKTEPNTAFFWSGRTEGIGGMDNAANIAKAQGGTTLEMLIDKHKIQMPSWNDKDPVVVKEWGEMSRAYAQGTCGLVRGVVGQELRPNSIWERYEKGALMQNPAVGQIDIVDPKYGLSKTIFKR